MKEKKEKILRADQAVILGAACLIGGFLLGLLSYHLIMGPSEAMPVASQQQQAPMVASAPGQGSTNYTAQINEVKNIVATDPGNRSAWVTLGNLYFDSNRYKESVDAYTKALELGAGDANVLTDRGIMYKQLGMFEEAVADFKAAAAADATHYQSLYNLGLTMLHDLQDNKGALEAWEEMVRRNPASEPEMRTRLEALRAMGDEPLTMPPPSEGNAAPAPAK